MTADGVLVLSWLVLAHLVADFVLQTGSMVLDKGSNGRRALRGIVSHGAVVGILLLPVVAAYGPPGLVLVVVVTVSHGLVDRAKVVLTRRAEATALAEAHRTHEDPAPEAGLGSAWTPVPGALFAIDQVIHAAIVVAAWWAIIATAPLEPGFVEVAARLAAGVGEPTFHRAILTGLIVVALVIVNVRAGSLFVSTLVRPLPAVGRDHHRPDRPAGSAVHGVATGRPGGTTWRFRVGPLVGRVDSDPAPGHRPPRPPGIASPARVGEAIGIIERLLIAGLVLAGAEVAIGLVVAAKTLARFRQLDDREFAEYYLLGTLASVGVSVGSALLAGAALGTVAA